MQHHQGFYESAFTHANVGRLTRHNGGHDALWTELRGSRRPFPTDTLIRLPQTLAQFIGSGRCALSISFRPVSSAVGPCGFWWWGAGETGSAIVMGLPYLHQAMTSWAHPYGLEVTLMDGDAVSETNCVRQPFSWSDVGQNKATVLINRINLFWGTKWNALSSNFDETTLRANHDRNPDFLIGCVDTRAARGVIDRSVCRNSSYVRYWLDLGNNASSGQSCTWPTA